MANETRRGPEVEQSKQTGEQSATSDVKSDAVPEKAKPVHTADVWKSAVSDLGRFTRAAGTARVAVVADRLVECLSILTECYTDSRINPSAYSGHQVSIGGGQNVSCRAALFLRLGVPALASDAMASKRIAGNPKVT